MAKKTSHITARTLSPREINRATLARQMLLTRESMGAVAAVERLAGMQAQYSPSPYIGLWTRLNGFRIEELTEALHSRQIVKASLMRWTLHLASARDYPYFSRAVVESRIAGWRSTAEQAGLNTEDLHAKLIEFASEPRLQNEMHDFVNSQVPSVPERYPRAMWHAVSGHGGLVQIPPSGMWKYFGKNYYISTREWLGQTEETSLSGAIVHLVRRYLGAFGPATRADVVSWAGLRKVSHVDEALRTLGDEIVTFKDEEGNVMYDLEQAPRPGGDTPAPPRYLPKWDNLLLAYGDRKRVLSAEYRKLVIGKNGDVLPTILVDGRVVGTWSVKTERKTAALSVEPFEEIDPESRRALEDEGEALVRFMEPEAEGFEVRISGHRT